MYRISFITDTTWVISNPSTLENVDIIGFNPYEHKLANGDTFTYENTTVTILHSPMRIDNDIPGVLILNDNKTYGREKKYKQKTATITEGRLLYKCIPDDKRLPSFLIPYEITQLGFSKALNNLYVTFQFKHWDDKHPRATLTRTIGPTDILDNFYEYQLFCKSLNTSIQHFNKATNNALKIKNFQQGNDTSFIQPLLSKFHDRKSWKIFTIDSSTTTDFDDAIGIKHLENNTLILSIYIANVAVMMDFLNIWSSFSQRISTIYLPDRKRPMLPTILSECLCSLQSGKPRIAFTMDIILDAESNILAIEYHNTSINVYKNHIYDSDELLSDNNYTQIKQIVTTMSTKYNYVSSINDSHDVITYLMILMNYHSAKKLLEFNKGIFRSCSVKQNDVVITDIPDDVNKFIKMWNSTTTQYVIASDNIKHDFLDIDAYVHITSPIRRLVDLLNITTLQTCLGLETFSTDCIEFCDKWTDKLEYINTTMRSIRRVQTDCALLDACNSDSDILTKIYNGYCFDKIVRNDGLIQCFVYIPELKLASKLTTKFPLNNFEKHQFKLHLFNDEERFKRKIRLECLT